MHRTLTDFEAEVLEYLTNPNPAPKFPLWEKVQFTKNDKTYEGTINGYYYQSVDVAFESSIAPGWWYCLEHDSDIQNIHEDHIIGAVEL